MYYCIGYCIGVDRPLGHGSDICAAGVVWLQHGPPVQRHACRGLCGSSWYACQMRVWHVTVPQLHACRGLCGSSWHACQMRVWHVMTCLPKACVIRHGMLAKGMCGSSSHACQRRVWHVTVPQLSSCSFFTKALIRIRIMKCLVKNGQYFYEKISIWWVFIYDNSISCRAIVCRAISCQLQYVDGNWLHGKRLDKVYPCLFIVYLFTFGFRRQRVALWKARLLCLTRWRQAPPTPFVPHGMQASVPLLLLLLLYWCLTTFCQLYLIFDV